MVLTEVGIDCVALHSMISQRLRLAALTKFKSSRAKIMVATDVGSRYSQRTETKIAFIRQGVEGLPLLECGVKQ